MSNTPIPDLEQRLSVLKKRARKLGVSEEELDDAEDSATPTKRAVIALIEKAKKTAAAGPQSDKIDLYWCDKDCGFSGTFAEVEAHEKKCKDGSTVAQIKHIYDSIDVDNDGVLEKKEIRLMMERMGEHGSGLFGAWFGKLTEKKVQKAFAEMDMDNRGSLHTYISFSLFRKLNSVDQNWQKKSRL